MTLDTAVMLAVLEPHFPRAIRVNEPLARHGTFGVGGPADVWVNVSSEAGLLTLASLASARGWPVMLVGNGTNVLYADAGSRGIVARMTSDSWSLQVQDDEHALLVAGAGVSLPKLINDLAEAGYTGLEWGAGVPGTIGGAVVSNAGAHGACVADTLLSARVLFTHPSADAEPEIRVLEVGDIGLSYRHSRFRAERRVAFDDDGNPVAAPRAAIEPPEMITGATFLLARDEPARIRERVRAYRQHRKDTQPPQQSAGSVFKNPPGDYAGRLIEACGLKGMQVGTAVISARHANFIVNMGGATAANVAGLVALARRRVREQFGIELELELELRGDW